MYNYLKVFKFGVAFELQLNEYVKDQCNEYTKSAPLTWLL